MIKFIYPIYLGYDDDSNIIFWFPSIPLLGPTIYFYIKSTAERDFTFKISQIWHWLLAFSIIVIGSIINFETDYLWIILLGTRIHLVIYSIITIFYIYRIKRMHKNQVDYNYSIRNVFFYCRNTILIISPLLLTLVLNRFSEAFSIVELFYIPLLIFTITFFEIKFKKISEPGFFPERYKNSSITESKALALMNKIKEHFLVHKPYLDNTLTLPKLAKEYQIQPYVLSNIVNNKFGMPFNDFINSYRIEEAKKMLNDPERENYTIASIAYDCGFNTLSAFNGAFKKFTGYTPTQFRLKQQANKNFNSIESYKSDS
ncbi:MAG: hypothetical protein A2W99_03425 [Bacteroidetes bacterium GWF2_33_16]|nr:MAG: hypothetical protein A2X00_11645 [Bacteroidetes bacterium GWE2_32_14]OFY08237.1 MAG: hypothetical protein A2W99_03425 [Bacteroidetes bacterium GWF2_33_16]